MAEESLKTVGDRKLLARMTRYHSTERRALAKFLRFLAEFDRRRLWAQKGYASCFKFLVHAMNFAESMASKRLSTARLGREYPSLFTYISTGELSLTTASMVASHLREEKDEKPGLLIERVRGLTKNQLSELFARSRPVEPKDEAKSVSIAVPPEDPEDPEARTQLDDRVQVTVTLTREEYEDLKRLQALYGRKKEKTPKLGETVSRSVQDSLDRKDPERKAKRYEERKAAKARRHSCAGPGMTESPANTGSEPKPTFSEKVPHANGECCETGEGDADLAKADSAEASTFSEKVAQGKKGRSRTTRSRRSKNSRYIPARVKHEVWGRDGGRCTYVSGDGHRCDERCNLEIDHIIPYSLGGRSDSKNNLRLRCPAHNLLAARQVFGEDFILRKIKESQEQTFSGKVVSDESYGRNGGVPDLWPSLSFEDTGSLDVEKDSGSREQSGPPGNPSGYGSTVDE